MKILKYLGIFLVVISVVYLLFKDISATKQLAYFSNNFKSQSDNRTYISTQHTPSIDSINAKTYFELAEKNFKASENIFSSMRWTYTFTVSLITLFISMFVFLGLKYILPIFLDTQIKDWADKSIEFNKIKKDMLDNSREINLSLAILKQRDGVDRWKESAVERAIELTEKAFEFFRKACNEGKPRGKDDQILWGTICGNLSYYYAQIKNHAKYDEALSYARISLKIGIKYHIMHLVENFPYVVKQYDIKDPLIKKEAKEIIETYRGDFLGTGILTSAEIEEYLKMFSQ